MAGKDKRFRPENHKALVEKFRDYYTEYDYSVSESGPAIRRKELSSGLEKYSGPWEDENRAHLLKRTVFGPKKAELAYLRQIGFEEAVNDLLTPVELPPPPVNNYNNPSEGIIDPDTPSGETWVEAPWHNDYEGYKILSLKGWLMENILNSPTSIHHKLTFFWHNLLVTQFWDIFQAKASYQYYTLLHNNAFGNFKTLIREITKNPAMLIYLNGTRNNKEAPDENYARELQELFCIGKGAGSGYTEGDVQAAARVLTGWVVEADSLSGRGAPASFFYPPWHEEADKNFSAFYGNKVIEGKSGAAGAEELDELLDMIFDNDETALYVCRRLYNFFIYSEIDDQVEEQIIQPLADIFRDNNYEIEPVVKALFLSAHFNDPANHGVVIKNPLDFFFSGVRGLDLSLYDQNNFEEQLATLNSFFYWTTLMGLEIGDPPSVAGWPAYYQVPQFDKSWITTDSITKRAQITDMVSYAYFANEDLYYMTDFISYIKSFDDPAYPDTLLAEAELLLLGIPLGEKSRAILKSILLAGQQEDYHWTLAWNDHLREPDNEELKNVVQNRLRSTFTALLQQGEFHLM